MDPTTVTLIWLIAGLTLSVAELVIPGLVVIFLGVSAILVAGLRWAFGLENLMISFTLWAALSGGLVYVMRGVANKLITSERQPTQFIEDEASLGAIVDVVQSCSDDSNEGRIRYQGTTWSATCLNGTIPKGHKAKIIARDNLTWVIEPADELEAFALTEGLDHDDLRAVMSAPTEDEAIAEVEVVAARGGAAARSEHR